MNSISKPTTETNGLELWKYDGTNAPSMVADINSGSGNSLLSDLTVFNNELYFEANDSINGYELWKYSEQTTITYGESNSQEFKPLSLEACL